MTRHGFKDATTDPDPIRAWWTDSPNANIGLATGAVSGLVVVDVDIDRHSTPDGMSELSRRLGDFEIPPTLTVSTGGGGKHIYFRTTEPIKSRKLPGIGDLKADGGYVIAAPSRHDSGELYEVCEDRPLALLPAGLIAALTAQPSAPQRPLSAPLAPILKGTRNNTLTRLAGSMHGRGISQLSIELALQSENELRCQPPLSAADVSLIVQSITKRPRKPLYSNGGTFWPRDFVTELWKTRDHMRLYLYLVGEAVHMDVDGGPSGPRLQGEVFASYRKIRDDCEWVKNNKVQPWGPGRVKKLLDDLQAKGFISVRPTGHGTLITITNYSQHRAYPVTHV